MICVLGRSSNYWWTEYSSETSGKPRDWLFAVCPSVLIGCLKGEYVYLVLQRQSLLFHNPKCYECCGEMWMDMRSFISADERDGRLMGNAAVCSLCVWGEKHRTQNRKWMTMRKRMKEEHSRRESQSVSQSVLSSPVASAFWQLHFLLPVISRPHNNLGTKDNGTAFQDTRFIQLRIGYYIITAVIWHKDSTTI